MTTFILRHAGTITVVTRTDRGDVCERVTVPPRSDPSPIAERQKKRFKSVIREVFGAPL